MRRPQNLKNLPFVLTKQLFLLSIVKTSGRFFQIFVAFSEKLNFNFKRAFWCHRYNQKINFLNLKFNAGLNVNFEYQLRHYEKATKI